MTQGGSKKLRSDKLWAEFSLPKGAEKASCGETVLQQGVFLESPFLYAPLKFALKALENLKGAKKKRTLQKYPFGQSFLCTTLSPLLWRTPPKRHINIDFLVRLPLAKE